MGMCDLARSLLFAEKRPKKFQQDVGVSALNTRSLTKIEKKSKGGCFQWVMYKAWTLEMGMRDLARSSRSLLFAEKRPKKFQRDVGVSALNTRSLTKILKNQRVVDFSEWYIRPESLKWVCVFWHGVHGVWYLDKKTKKNSTRCWCIGIEYTEFD